MLVLLAATWGSSFLFIKLAVATIPPVTVAAGRIAVGAAALGIVVALRRPAMPIGADAWPKLAAMAILGYVVPFALISWGETRIDSGLTAILMSAVPIFTLLIAHAAQRDEPLTTGKVVGVMVGFAGIVILVGPSAFGGLGGQLLGQLAVLAATLCYAGNSIVTRRLTGVRFDAAAAAMLVIATVIAVPICLAVDRPWLLEPSWISVIAVVALGLLSTAFGSLLLILIIARAGAGFSAFNNYLVPVFGIFWGALILGEAVDPWALLALAVVMLGIAAPRAWPGRIGTVRTRFRHSSRHGRGD